MQRCKLSLTISISKVQWTYLCGWAALSKSIIKKYLQDSSEIGKADLSKGMKRRVGEGKFSLSAVECRNAKGEISSTFAWGEIIRISVDVRAESGAEIVLGVGVKNWIGEQILHFCNLDDKKRLISQGPLDTFILEFANPLISGDYFITAWLGDRHEVTQDYVEDCVRLKVENSNLGKSRLRSMVIVPGKWQSGRRIQECCNRINK